MVPNATGETPPRDTVVSSDSLWPTMIIVGLLLVVIVNIAFVTIAVSGQDDVVPSYVEGDRWGGDAARAP